MKSLSANWKYYLQRRFLNVKGKVFLMANLLKVFSDLDVLRLVVAPVHDVVPSRRNGRASHGAIRDVLHHQGIDVSRRCRAIASRQRRLIAAVLAVEDHHLHGGGVNPCRNIGAHIDVVVHHRDVEARQDVTLLHRDDRVVVLTEGNC